MERAAGDRITITAAAGGRGAARAAVDGVTAAARAIAATVGVPVEDLERRDGHLSVVFLTGSRAFRVFLAVSTTELDRARLEGRLRAARTAVRRGSVSAPRTYVGVRAVVPYDEAFVLADAPHADAVEYVVEMRRFVPEETLLGRLSVAPIGPETTAEIGRALVARHRALPPAAFPPEGPGASQAHAVHELDRVVGDLTTLLGKRGDRDLTAEVHRRLRAFARRNEDRLSTRAAAGELREAPGDLRADRVLVTGAGGPGGVELLTAAETAGVDPPAADAAADVAALVSDLLARGDAPLGDRIAEAYRVAGGDPGTAALRAFYGAQRLLRRALDAELAAPSASRVDGPSPTRVLLELADHVSWQTLSARSLVLCGVPGSGKSHLAHLLSARSGWPIVSSEATRRIVAGASADSRDRYVALVTDTAYEELGREAAGFVARGGGLIVDASCGTRRSRDAFREGLASHASAMCFIECAAPADVLIERLARRPAGSPRSIGEGSRAIEPLDEVPGDRHVVLRTDRRAVDVLADLAVRLEL